MTNEQSGIVDLLKILRDDTTTLVRDEISLAKTEISEKIASTSRNVGYLAAGGPRCLCRPDPDPPGH